MGSSCRSNSGSDVLAIIQMQLDSGIRAGLNPCRLSSRRNFKVSPLVNLKDKGQFQVNVPSLTSEYEVLETVGKGGFSIVKRAIRKDDNTVVAVKISHCVDCELQAMALEEHRILSSLCHRDILSVVALHECVISKTVFLVLEFCTAGSVDSYIQKCGPFQDNGGSCLIEDLIEGVHYLHSSRFVHRDLKPENLLLQKGVLRNLSLKIADFGCAKQIGCNSPGCGKMLTDRGSHSYMAPEIIFGLVWNERIDIWSMGLCSYYMLKGGIPFNILEPAVMEILHKQKLPNICWEGICGPMKESIQRSLTVQMENRPSAMELLLDQMSANAPATGRRRSWGCSTPSVPEISRRKLSIELDRNVLPST